MLSKENLEEILAIALSRGGDFADIFIEENVSNSILLEDNRIEKITSGTSSGAGIRIIAGDIISYASTSLVNLEEMKKAAKLVSESIPKQKPKTIKTLKPTISNLAYPIKIRPNEVSIKDKIDPLMLANKTVRKFGDSIKQATIRYGDSNQSITIANSDGIYIEDNRIHSRYFINVIVAKDNILETGYEGPGASCGFELFEKYPIEKFAAKASERALLMLSAPHAPSGTMPVILTSEAGGVLIHEACGHGLEADFIMKETSVYAGKIGQKVASELVTIIDDGTIIGNYGTFRFDDEGTPSQKNILIENGILKGFMSDRYNARKLNLKPSGNGRRESFHSKPQPRMTNTYMAPGKMDPQEVIDSIKNGLLVKHMGGGQVNVTNGDFVFQITEGYIIENGKIKHPVRGAIITGNGPQILREIDMVGNDLHFIPGVCGKFDHAPVTDAQPTTRIPKITVGGR